MLRRGVTWIQTRCYILDDGHANDTQFDHSRQMLMMVPPKITISVLVIYLTFRPMGL